MVWYSHLLKNFPQFVVIHTVKGFGIVNKVEVDVFLELSCPFDDPVDVGNLISGSSAFSKTSLNIWKSRLNFPQKDQLIKCLLTERQPRNPAFILSPKPFRWSVSFPRPCECSRCCQHFCIISRRETGFVLCLNSFFLLFVSGAQRLSEVSALVSPPSPDLIRNRSSGGGAWRFSRIAWTR